MEDFEQIHFNSYVSNRTNQNKDYTEAFKQEVQARGLGGDGFMSQMGEEKAVAKAEEIIEPQQKITEEQLLHIENGEFAKQSKILHKFFEGEQFEGSDQEAVQYGLDVMGEFTFNFAGMPVTTLFQGESEANPGGTLAQAAALIFSGTKQDAKAFLHVMDRYDMLPNISQNGMKRMLRGLGNDPSVWGSIASGGVGLLAKKFGIDATKGTIRSQLTNLAAAPAKLAMEKPIATSAVVSGGITGVSDVATQGVEIAAGEEASPIDRVKRALFSTAIGTAAGAAIPTTLAAVGRPLADVAGQAARDATPLIGKTLDAIEGAGDAAKARMADADGSVTLTSGVDPDPAIAAVGGAVKAMRGTQPVADKTISQRLPTAVASTEDPIATKLVTDTATTLQQPDKKLQSNFEKISAYPNMPDNLKDMNFQDAAVTVKQHIVDNLLFLHDRVPENTRQRSKLWYDGANKISNDYATQYNVPLESVSGVMAALSPQKDWYMNADLGRRVIDIHNRVTKGNEVNMAMTPEMTTKMGELFSKGGVTKPKDAVIIEAISGKKFSDLELPAEKAMWLRVYDETYNERSYPIVNPEGTFGDLVKTTKGENAKAGWGSLSEIGKAITSLESGGDLKVISDAMGGQNKVRNFYNNIYNPNSANGDVTIDTHAVAAGWLRPLAGDSTEVHHNFGSAPDAKKRDERWSGGMSNTSITGIKGIYGIFADAYREAAAQRGILPREMQSITWEAVRGLFPATDKGNKAFVEDITKIWYDYKQGTKTLEEAQNAVEQRAGYINEPTWKQ